MSDNEYTQNLVGAEAKTLLEFFREVVEQAASQDTDTVEVEVGVEDNTIGFKIQIVSLNGKTAREYGE